MIWLASYPRSGNTLARIILNQAFNAKSASLYTEGSDAMSENARKLWQLVGGDSDDAQAIFRKTHEGPLDDRPAIVVMRDGRAAVVSYFYYTRNVEKNEKITIERIIKGLHWPGSWSQVIGSWQPFERKNTLFVKYEDLVAAPQTFCEQVSSTFGIPQARDAAVSFESLQELDPRFFRSGDNEKNIKELEPHLALFDEHHGEMMRKLGYYS